MFLKYQFPFSHFKILCCVHCYFFFIIKNLSFSYLGFPEAFSMLSTPWLTQVGTHVPVNPPLSDRLPQKIDRLNYLKWFDFFISPELLFTRGKQRFPKAALWITPAYRKSPQRFVVTSGLWHPERNSTDRDPNADPGPAPLPQEGPTWDKWTIPQPITQIRHSYSDLFLLLSYN